MIKAYGANRRNAIQTKEEYHLEEFYNLGYTIIENAISAEEIKELKSELDRIYAIQEAGFGKANLKSINEEFLARALLVYSETYLNLARKPELMAYVEAILGNYFILHLQNGIINMPSEEHHQSSWHRDLPYQNWVSSEPLACNVFFCLDAFSEETGGTLLLPFSHKIPMMPSEKYLEKHALQVAAPAGSVLLFDSMVFHKAGFNRSNQIRRGVNHLYAKAIIRQQIDLPAALGGRYSDDPFLRVLLGYDNKSPENVDAFRSNRLGKQKSVM
jgi:ectoine hydroxylase-related dioxygenase (phytanoyl-CoA dioxygenase family)